MTTEAYDGYRVSIIGGCQIAGLGEWIRRLLQGATVEGCHVYSTMQATPAYARRMLAGSDLVVTQFSDEMADADQIGVSSLKSAFANVVFMPVFVFGGFHPDIAFTGLSDEPSAFVRGPLDVLQSAIALASYHLGVPVERVSRLYNALVFEILGYTRVFDAARAACIRVFAEHGYDLEEAFGLWMQSGCFMYSDNHPHIRVLRRFAEIILAKARLEAAPLPMSACAPDLLSNSVHWPVYPALARRMGIAGSTSFTRALHSVGEGEAREITLQEFVEASYRVFDAAGRGNLDRGHRVLADMDALRPLISH